MEDVKDEVVLAAIIDAIQEKKGEKIAVIDLKNISGAICNYYVICQGVVPVQVNAIATNVIRRVREYLQEKCIGQTGFEASQWIAVDYVSIMFHVFLPELRDYYRLEQLWHDASVTYIDDDK